MEKSLSTQPEPTYQISWSTIKTEISWPRQRKRFAFAAFKEKLLREMKLFMNERALTVFIFPCKPNDHEMKAEISFDGSLHLEAAMALEYIDGKSFSRPWQRIRCQRHFHSTVVCPASVYPLIQNQLHFAVNNLLSVQGLSVSVHGNSDGSTRFHVSANATKKVAEATYSLQQIIKGRHEVRHTPPKLDVRGPVDKEEDEEEDEEDYDDFDPEGALWYHDFDPDAGDYDPYDGDPSDFSTRWS